MGRGARDRKGARCLDFVGTVCTSWNRRGQGGRGEADGQQKVITIIIVWGWGRGGRGGRSAQIL